MGDVLEDGSSRNTGLGLDSVSYRYREVSTVGEAVERFSLSLSLANVSVAESGNLDLSTDWVLMSLECLTDHHRFCGALGLSVTSLTHHHSLRDGLTDWQGMHNGSRVGISQAIERISLSISCRGSNGSGGQEGKLEDGLEMVKVRYCCVFSGRQA